MAFDLSTAKPESAAGGFDISTAAPEQQVQPQAPVQQPITGANPRARRASRVSQQRAAEEEAFLSSIDPAQRALIEEQSPLDAFLIGAGRGLTTIGRGVGLADPEPAAATQAIEDLRQVQGGPLLAGEVTGEAAPFVIPGTQLGRIATLTPRVAATGTLGATEGGIIRRGQGGTEKEIIEGAGLGGAIAGGVELALPVVGRIGSKIIKKITGNNPRSQVIDELGNPSQELQSALDKSGLTLDDLNQDAQRLITSGDPEVAAAQARKAFLEEQGLVPTRAQVTGTGEDFIRQQELAKSSEKVRRALGGQEQALVNRFENAITSTGGSANPSNAPVIDFIADNAINEDAAISAAYKAAREAVPDAKVVSPNGMIEEIRSIAGSDNVTGGLASAARDILRNKGLLEGKGLKPTGRVSPQVAEEIRIELNGLHDSLTPLGKRKLAAVKGGLDSDVENSVGEDFFAEARAAKRKFEKDLSRAKVNKFDNRKFNLVRDVLENKISPDRFLDEAVLSKRVRSTDLEQLKRYLQLDDNPDGIDAWNSLRAESMQRIRNDAFNVVGGEPAMTRASINKAVDKFGRDKLRVLFSPQERKFLNDMKKVSEIREPKRGTQQGLGPSAQAVIRAANSTKSGSFIREIFGEIQLNRAGRATLNPQIIERAKLKPVAAGTVAALPLAAAAQQENK